MKPISWRELPQRRHIMCALCALALIAWSLDTVFAAQTKTTAPSTSTASTLEQDLRLQHPITIQATNITLEELLAKFSTRGLLLSADGNCSPQKLQIRLNHKPLSTLMQALAQLIPGSWEPRADGHGYLFIMSPQAVRRRSRWWELFLGERQRAKDAQRAMVLKTMHTPPRRLVRAYVNGQESPELAERDFREQSFLRELPSSLQEHIADHMVDVAFDLGYTTDLIPADEGVVTVPFMDLSAEARDTVKLVCGDVDWSHVPPEELTCSFNNFGTGVRVHLTLPPETDSGEPVPVAGLNVNVDLAPDATMLPLDHTQLSWAIRKMGRSAPAEWKELAAYQDSRVWPNDPPQDLVRRLTQKYRADVLDWFAQQADMEFVADYSSIGSNSVLQEKDKQQPLPHDLKVEMDELARDQDVSWRRSSGLYLIRNNRWYRDDVLEIPTALLRNLWQRYTALKDPVTFVQTHGVPPDIDTSPAKIKARLDWEADVVSQLTDLQIGSCLASAVFEKEDTLSASPPSAATSASAHPERSAHRSIVIPFVAIAARILYEKGAARFYAGLDEGQREALLAGQLPISTLSPDQRQKILAILPGLEQYSGSQALNLGLRFHPAPSIYLANVGSEPPGRSMYLVATPSH